MDFNAAALFILIGKLHTRYLKRRVRGVQFAVQARIRRQRQNLSALPNVKEDRVAVNQ